jgi:hydrogenase maturation protease
MPESGPTSMVIRSTALAPRLLAISATCPRSAWQTDSSCTAAGYRMGDFCYVRQRTDRATGGVVRFSALKRGHALTSRFGQHTKDDSPDRRGAGAAAFRLVTPRALVLGFGNVLLSDDGAGIRLVERLRSELGADAAEFVDGGTLSFSLLPYVEATHAMLVIDAANLDGEPGAIGLFEGAAMDEFLKISRRRTVHEVGLIDLLDMARLLGCLPDQRALLCIQPGRIDWCETLSGPVAKGMPEASRQARAMLERWAQA